MWESSEAYGTSNDFGILRVGTMLANNVIQGVVNMSQVVSELVQLKQITDKIQVICDVL